MVRKVKAWQETLKQRERANFDIEDTLAELWIRLAEKDRLWKPEKGRYVSFAGAVIDTELDRLRARTKTVRTPGSASSRLKEYSEKDAEGRLTPSQAVTATRLRAAVAGQSCLHPALDDEWRDEQGIPADAAVCGTIGPDEEAGRNEEVAATRSVVARSIARLDAEEAMLLGEAFGLWGQEARTIGQIAAKHRRSARAIREKIAAALAKCREHLPADAA